MIPITPEIMGPGIEEEYADALSAIAERRRALGPQPLTNHTPEGRVSMEIDWLELQISAHRLPIPVDPSYVNTIYHLVGSNELAGYPGFQSAIGRLSRVLKGYGLLKARHIPILIAMIDDFTMDASQSSVVLPLSDTTIVADLRQVADRLRHGGPLPEPLPPQEQNSARSTKALDDNIANGFNRLSSIDASLYEGWRPRPARKPPLPAPIAGLPDRAPPLPRAMDGKLPWNRPDCIIADITHAKLRPLMVESI